MNKNLKTNKSLLIKLKNGLTLLEIIIYISIFSICMVSLVTISSSVQKTVVNIKFMTNLYSFEIYLREFLRFIILKKGYLITIDNKAPGINQVESDEVIYKNNQILLDYLKNDSNLYSFFEKISKIFLINYSDFDVVIEYQKVVISYNLIKPNSAQKRTVIFDMI